MQRPSPNEYRSFFEEYISLVPEGDYFAMFRRNTAEVAEFFSSVPEEKHDFRYAPGKWTVKQVLMHITDTERVLGNRIFVMIRGDRDTLLQSFDENSYADHVDVSVREISNLVQEFLAGRKQLGYILQSIGEDNGQTPGLVNGHPTTPRAIAHIIPGHAIHHLKVVAERYL